jgi:hypothetical protein
MTRAYCFPSGLIGFGHDIPKGARIIARGPRKELRDFIAVKARHGYRARKGVLVAASDILLVPGMPEADDADAARNALLRWTRFIAIRPPKHVRVILPTERSAADAR